MSSPNGVGEHPLDYLAAYAVDALDDAERQVVDAHLARCVACRDELAGHHETLGTLATLTSEEPPPAAVWQRIVASIDTPAPAVATVRSLTERPRPRIGSRWLAAAAAGLAAAAITGGALGYALGSSGDSDADIASLAEQASEDPGGVRATLADTSGDPVAQIVADEDGAFVVLSGLEDLPEGRAYQLWSLTGSEPVSLGMLGRDGTNTVAFRLPPTITELAISEAPTNGDVAPVGDFRASGTVTQS